MKALVDHHASNIALFPLLSSPPWEFGQMWLCGGASEMSHFRGIQICMAATLGDAGIMMFAFGIAAAATRTRQGWR